jgi:hypothetical protein
LQARNNDYRELQKTKATCPFSERIMMQIHSYQYLAEIPLMMDCWHSLGASH